MIVFRKSFLAITGLFICFFLTAHLGANFLLLLPAETARNYYNSYSAFLRGNIFVTVIAYVNYLCILFHIYYAVIISIKNKSARSIQYELKNNSDNSSWSSQNMLFLGALIFCFLVIHMANFWFKVKFQHNESDLYQMVFNLFHEPLYVAIYVFSALPLGLHLSHGVKSAFKTLGLYHKKYLRWIADLSVIYATVVGIGFGIIPIILFFK